jgi:hypothetical protein
MRQGQNRIEQNIPLGITPHWRIRVPDHQLQAAATSRENELEGK